MFSIFNSETLLANHLESYYKYNTITIDSINKVYSRYTTYLILLLISIIAFSLFSILSLFKIGILFFALFMILIIFMPSFFIFNNSLLSTSRLILLLISYLFTIMSFALIFYSIQMLSIEHIKDMKDVAFNISGYTTINEVKNFNNPLSFFYFSIVTITTLGYGDITPLSGIAKIASSIEVILGITYAVLGVGTLFSSKNNDKAIVCLINKNKNKRKDKETETS